MLLCRMWGRLLGVTFLVPGTYFLARGFINGALAKRLGLLFFMGGTQGLVGWWMVRSGLKVRGRAMEGLMDREAQVVQPGVDVLSALTWLMVKWACGWWAAISL